MFSDTLISPKSDHTIRTRYANFKRTGAPNFRDILRQRCRERVKAKRHHLFDHLRSLQNEESVRNAISQFIVSDLEELKLQKYNESDENGGIDTIDDQPLSQLAVNEQEKWILEEYDRLIETTNAQAELAYVVVCPICAQGVLQVGEGGNVICSLCSLLLPHVMPLAELEKRIMEAVDSHGQYCQQEPQFVICPDTFTSNLLLLCSECGKYHQIV